MTEITGSQTEERSNGATEASAISVRPQAGDASRHVDGKSRVKTNPDDRVVRFHTALFVHEIRFAGRSHAQFRRSPPLLCFSVCDPGPSVASVRPTRGVARSHAL